jgi:hypothetical protein
VIDRIQLGNSLHVDLISRNRNCQQLEIDRGSCILSAGYPVPDLKMHSKRGATITGGIGRILASREAAKRLGAFIASCAPDPFCGSRQSLQKRLLLFSATFAPLAQIFCLCVQPAWGRV